MVEKLTQLTDRAVSELYQIDIKAVFTRPDEAHGDFATNVALQLAGKVSKPARQVAEELAKKLESLDKSLSLEIAGPGFINVRLSDEDILQAAKDATNLQKPLADKVVVAEYSDPNAFKVLHAGHLYTSLVGDAIANIMQAAGADVKRVNFGGDVGRHVAQTMWAIIEELGGEHPDKLTEIEDNKKLAWVSEKYVAGTSAYEDNPEVKDAIKSINERVYKIHSEQDKTSPFAQIYWTCRQWSYDGFEDLYKRLGMKPFDKYYPESSVFDIGLQTVREHTGQVYEESDGAIVFRGEPYGLFTQVFINSEGLPTYAGKDVGLIQQKYADYKFDTSFMLTDVAQKDHIAVVLKSIEQFEPKLANNTVHHTHGRIKLEGNQKMSSRKGNVLTADEILETAFAASHKSQTKGDDQIVLGAVRYSFLRVRTGGDIVYSPEESVSLEGNSGPYVQYALVRARSILRKAGDSSSQDATGDLQPAERSLARQIGIYPEAFAEALTDYSPHHICAYVFETCQAFNRFYERSRVIGDSRSAVRLELVRAYEAVLAHALNVLGMPTPEEM